MITAVITVVPGSAGLATWGSVAFLGLVSTGGRAASPKGTGQLSAILLAPRETCSTPRPPTDEAHHHSVHRRPMSANVSQTRDAASAAYRELFARLDPARPFAG